MNMKYKMMIIPVSPERVTASDICKGQKNYA